MTNILIGIGGTGAKVVEAALTLFAAGIGPDNVHVGLIDQDQANGNVNRTQARLNTLQAFQRIWREGHPGCRLDWGGDAAGRERLDFCSVKVEQMFGTSALWFPQGTDASLSSLIGQDLSREQRDLFDLLFMPNEEEQDLRLGEGYRGRAHVGAAALVAAMLNERNPLVRTLDELMERVTIGEPVRIFLIGSAFGGTGAAGFPTLARELHRIRSAPAFKNRDMVAIGGALMLPYFGFARPAEDGQPVVTTDELLPKARLALEYYGRLFETERTFDRFYVLGWDPMFNLGYHEPGNFEQRNPPLLPELFAATAAVDFLRRADVTSERPIPPVMLSAREDRGVRWSDLPLAERDRDKLAQLVRFSAYWLHVAEPLLRERSWFSDRNWTQKLRGRRRAGDHETELSALRTLAAEVLTWAAGIQRTAADHWAPGLWDVDYFTDAGHRPTPNDLVRIAQPGTIPLPETGFDTLIREVEGGRLKHHPGTADRVYGLLLKNDPSLSGGNHEDYGKVVAAAYRAVGERFRAEGSR